MRIIDIFFDDSKIIPVYWPRWSEGLSIQEKTCIGQGNLIAPILLKRGSKLHLIHIYHLSSLTDRRTDNLSLGVEFLFLILR